MKKYHFSFDSSLKRHQYPGLYIALEGVDGSGKSSQLDVLKDYFSKKGKTVVTTREPRRSGGVISDVIDQTLLGNIKLPSVAIQYLFTADRWIQFSELVIPALKKGQPFLRLHHTHNR